MHGASFASSLRVDPRARSLGLVVEGYRTDNPARKAEAINALDVAFSRGALRVPSRWTDDRGAEHEVAHAGMLAKELRELVIDYLPSGKVRYDHPQGGHDDGVVALALAWQAVSERPRSPIPRNLSRWMQQPGATR